MKIIGVDPAFRKGGFWSAILDTQNKTVEFKPFNNVFEFADFVKELVGSDVFFSIENSNANNVTFKKSNNPGIAARYSRDAGKNQAVSELAVQYVMLHHGSNYHIVHAGDKKKGWKEQSRFFHAIVKSDGYTLLTPQRNQDQCDAYFIAMMGYSNFKLTNKLTRGILNG